MLRRAVMLALVLCFALPAVAFGWVDLHVYDDSVSAGPTNALPIVLNPPVPLFWGWKVTKYAPTAQTWDDTMKQSNNLWGLYEGTTIQTHNFRVAPSVPATGAYAFVAIVEDFHSVDTLLPREVLMPFQMTWIALPNALYGWVSPMPNLSLVSAQQNQNAWVLKPGTTSAFSMAVFARVVVDGVTQYRARAMSITGGGGIATIVSDDVKSSVGPGPGTAGMDLRTLGTPRLNSRKVDGTLFTVFDHPEGYTQSVAGGFFAAHTTDPAEVALVYGDMLRSDLATMGASAVGTGTAGVGQPVVVAPPVPPSIIPSIPPSSVIPTFSLDVSGTPAGVLDQIKTFPQTANAWVTNLVNVLFWPFSFMKWAFAEGAL